MRILQTLWNDIKHGKNIDLYATITVAFGLVMLNFFGITSQGLANSVILTVLGFLAISALVNRSSFEQLSNELKQVKDSVEKQSEKWPQIVTNVINHLGTPTEIIFEPLDTGTGALYRKLIEYIKKTSAGDEILIMTHYGRHVSSEDHPQERAERKESRLAYSQALLQKAWEPEITYRRIICFEDGLGQIKSEYVKQWMVDHCKEMLDIKKTKPGKISLKKGKVIFDPEILIIRGKLAVMTLDILDPASNLVHTAGGVIFHNPPNTQVVNLLYEFFMITDSNSRPEDRVNDT